MTNSNQLQAQQMPFTQWIRTKGCQATIQKTLGDPNRAMRFTSAIISAVSVNPDLQLCEPSTVLTAALQGEALNLNPSPQLGQYYMVPFKIKGKDTGEKVMKAQFILGYKGYIQLALRTGQYRKLNVVPIKAGELISYDPLNEEISVSLITDPNKRESAETIGYYAMFEYTNGFRKTLYWTKEQMLAHADKYSKAFHRADYEKLLAGQIPDRDLWKYSSFWYKDFDMMAMKTMLRQIISHWGITTTEMVTANSYDSKILEVDSDTGEVITLDASDFISDVPAQLPEDVPEPAPEDAQAPANEEAISFDQL